MPQVRYGAGAAAAGPGPPSMIDVSDGLLADLGSRGHGLRGVGIDLRGRRFEVPDPLQAVAVGHRQGPVHADLDRGRGSCAGGHLPGAARDAGRLDGDRRGQAADEIPAGAGGRGGLGGPGRMGPLPGPPVRPPGC